MAYHSIYFTCKDNLTIPEEYRRSLNEFVDEIEFDAYVDEHGIPPKSGIAQLLDYMEENGIAAAITSKTEKSRLTFRNEG